VALTWALLYPYSRDPRRGLASWGDPMLQYWSLAWAAHALRTAPARLFEANIYYPYAHTLAYTDHLLGATIPVLPAIALGGAALGLNLAVLLAYLLAAAGAYLLAEDLTGNRPAGIAAALPFAFAPYRLANLPHLHTLSSGWLVLALWATLRLWRGGGRRWAAVLALAVLWQGLSSTYLFYALVVALGVTLIYLALAERRSFAWGRLGRLALALGLGLLALAAPAAMRAVAALAELTAE
jgi:hypothetical protein